FQIGKGSSDFLRVASTDRVGPLRTRMSFIETGCEKRALHSIGKKPRARRAIASQKPFSRDASRFE
ncbi:hypothetical protein, partial [Burkholderia gladioli]|uniref:hypothetical protein n=1 Tax=Burkholderia gladioli TaxID=28095 RepID=UPI001ABAD72A